MKKIFNDLLKNDNGKWSFKRVTALYILNVAIVYAFLPIFKEKFDVKEFVFASLLGYSATMIGLTQYQKIVEQKNNDTNE